MDKPCYINARPVDLGIMIPCYNEEDNVVGTLNNVVAALDGWGLSYQVLVVDDCSQDRTVERVMGFIEGASCPISCLSNHENEGLGYNYFLGARLLDSTYYMMINGDNVEPADDIRAIVERMGQADIIIPYLRDMRRRGWIRRWISAAYTFLVNLLSSNHLRYYNCPVLHRRENVLAFYSRWKTRGFGYQTEILCHLLAKGCTYEQVAIEGDVCTTRRTHAFRLKNILAVALTLLTVATRHAIPRRPFDVDESRYTVHGGAVGG